MTDVTQDGTPSPSGHRPGRRHFMTGACAAAAALAFTMAGRPGGPLGFARVFAATPGSGGDSGYDAFIALSQHLTGRTGFDQPLGQRVYAALARASSQFEQNVGALNTWLQGHGGVPSDSVTAALKSDQPELATTVGNIMRAWYLGLVGDSPHIQVVAYEKALMFDPVKDVLTIPSYCRDVPFYWTQKPDGG
ncbi:sugar dehydrogenase complex small subunit [Paraburkholderia acidipaludis]|uniref:sugar dehydrogenase complex small subunit n=1 Tax=Paraburkholderia acidipaludis TaxID=660537 RepID=UPI00047F6BCD|nr:sugar dehydrogenase complex small subunit [Paraburkholderia acidipaludis]